MKLTKNYLKKLIKEEIVKEIQALDNANKTQLANLEIKKLYLILRNEIFNYKKHYIETFPENFINNTLKPDINKVSFLTAMRSYKPTDNFKSQGINLIFTKSDEFKQIVLNPGGDGFKLLVINDPSIGADAVADKEGLYRIRFNPKFLFDSELDFKSMLQHELQHIIDYVEGESGQIEREEGQEEYWNSVVDYLATSHEIGAHAKQAAYIYYKNFPTDQVVQQQKLLTVSGKMTKSFDVYLNKFDEENINKELSFLSSDKKQKAINASNAYKNLLQRYFELFLNKN